MEQFNESTILNTKCRRKVSCKFNDKKNDNETTLRVLKRLSRTKSVNATLSS